MRIGGTGEKLNTERAGIRGVHSYSQAAHNDMSNEESRTRDRRPEPTRTGEPDRRAAHVPMDSPSGDSSMDSFHTKEAVPAAAGPRNAFAAAHPSHRSHDSHPSRSPQPAGRDRDAAGDFQSAVSAAACGRVAALHVGVRKKEPLASVESIRVVAGRGIEGDRFFRRSPGEENPHPGREITLIESEALEALAGETGISLEPRETRRNVLTRGISLNALVGRRFRVGETELEGIELCEPCGHLELLTHTGVKAGLAHRGGLRARITRGGEIRIGDTVTDV